MAFTETTPLTLGRKTRFSNYNSTALGFEDRIFREPVAKQQGIASGTQMGPTARFHGKGIRLKAEIPLIIQMVPKGGLEPLRVSPPPLQDVVPAKFQEPIPTNQSNQWRSTSSKPSELMDEIWRIKS